MSLEDRFYCIEVSLEDWFFCLWNKIILLQFLIYISQYMLIRSPAMLPCSNIGDGILMYALFCEINLILTLTLNLNWYYIDLDLEFKLIWSWINLEFKFIWSWINLEFKSIWCWPWPCRFVSERCLDVLEVAAEVAPETTTMVSLRLPEPWQPIEYRYDIRGGGGDTERWHPIRVQVWYPGGGGGGGDREGVSSCSLAE